MILSFLVFIQYCTLSNVADDNNLFSMGKNKDQVKSFLSSDFNIISNWFYENFMVLNPEKVTLNVLIKKLTMLKL